MSWGDHLAAWWIDEVASDPAYATEVVPLALEVLAVGEGRRYLDLGCGDGRMMGEVRRLGGRVIGCDVAAALARRAAANGPVVVGRLPELGWVRDACVDGAYLVLVLEHLDDPGPLVSEAARVIRPGGVLALVVNHPVFTSPGSGPFIDPDDGEVLWRWGPYLETGWSREPAGSDTVVFHHRPLGTLLTQAARAGFCLEELIERGVGDERAEADPLLAPQRHIPRLLGVRWRRDARCSSASGRWQAAEGEFDGGEPAGGG